MRIYVVGQRMECMHGTTGVLERFPGIRNKMSILPSLSSECRESVQARGTSADTKIKRLKIVYSLGYRCNDNLQC